jgi:signal transduction histidine kinase
VLDQVLRVAKIQLDAGVRVDTDYAAGALVACDAQRLKQVFLNLVLNAGQAITPPGRIAVSTRTAPEWVEVAIADDGCGMTPEMRERIFDPFFTTKPVGRGTGLGLSLAYEIVRSHGGELWCESEPGAGTTFHVRIPRHAEREAAPRDAG